MCPDSPAANVALSRRIPSTGESVPAVGLGTWRVFDVATNATPEQVKALFRRAFIIGRRFRLVHVIFGRGREHETIEVSTFRAYMDANAAEQVSGNERTSKGELSGMKHAVDASGRRDGRTPAATPKRPVETPWPARLHPRATNPGAE